MPHRSPLPSILRWTARVALVAVALIVVGAATAFGLSERRLRARHVVPDHPLVISTDTATIVRGQHVATIRGCMDCHGENLGGRIVVDNPALGRLAAPNLTSGGRGAELTTADWERAVRHGLRRDSSALLMMPSYEYATLSDEDLGAVIAYARSVAAVTDTVPSAKAGPLARVLHLAGQMPLVSAEAIDHGSAHRDRVAVEPTVEYGSYLATSCIGCHGQNLSGGKIAGGDPAWGPASNITPTGIGSWTEADLGRALREARRPDGSMIDTTVMPVRLLKQLTDVEVAALYAYLKTVPPQEFGVR